METQTDKFDSWAIVELMGHRKLAGKVTEETHFGVPLLRLDVPQAAGAAQPFLTQWYGGQSIYCLTPCDEATARAVATHHQPEPVHRYELPQLAAPARPPRRVFEEDDYQAQLEMDMVDDEGIGDGEEDDEEDVAADEVPEGGYERADAAFPAF